MSRTCWRCCAGRRTRAARWPAFASRAWYQPQLQRLHADDAAVRALDLDQLQRLAAGHGSRERFLTELTLDPPEATADAAAAPHRDQDDLVLSTLHSPKDQE